MWVEAIGWFAAGVLLLTLGRQVYTQWRERQTRGLSRWLFVGQLTASTAFLVYSWLVENWVFVVTNALLLVTAALGEWIFLRNRRLEQAGKGGRP
jgi:MtN3 and saliva related transmembrane protein